jgi:hypothetical protein
MATELKTYFMLYYIQRVRRWRCWLRYCYTRGKVAGSISGGVLGINFFHIILDSTEPLTQINTRKAFGDVRLAGG